MAAALAVWLLLGPACFEPPVAERAEIRFLTDGAASVAIEIRLESPERYEGHPQVVERLAQTERELVQAQDAWARRLAALEAERERECTDREGGRVTRSVRLARVGDAGRLRAFFADSNVQVDYTAGESWAEFALTPTGDGPATRDQRRRVRETMECWCAAAAEHFAAVGELWAYLERRPDRARACAGRLFEDDLAPAVREALPDLEAAERELVERAEQAMSRVAELLFEPPADGAWTLDELSRLVHDPFPAALRILVPGPVLEQEGFGAAAGAALEIEPLSLWTAFAALEGQFVAPDPLVAYAAHDARRPRGAFDLDAFLDRPRRRAGDPGAAGVCTAVERRLTPQPTYRVRWSTAAAPEEAPDDPFAG